MRRQNDWKCKSLPATLNFYLLRFDMHNLTIRLAWAPILMVTLNFKTSFSKILFFICILISLEILHKILNLQLDPDPRRLFEVGQEETPFYKTFNFEFLEMQLQSSSFGLGRTGLRPSLDYLFVCAAAWPIFQLSNLKGLFLNGNHDVIT